MPRTTVHGGASNAAIDPPAPAPDAAPAAVVVEEPEAGEPEAADDTQSASRKASKPK